MLARDGVVYKKAVAYTMDERPEIFSVNLLLLLTYWDVMHVPLLFNVHRKLSLWTHAGCWSW